MGFTVERVATCKDATSILLRKRFDVCLLDLMVQDGVTIGLADWIKVCTPSTQIIAVTGSSLSPYGELSINHGFDFELRKPVQLGDLQAVTQYVAEIA